MLLNKSQIPNSNHTQRDFWGLVLVIWNFNWLLMFVKQKVSWNMSMLTAPMTMQMFMNQVHSD